VNTEPREPQKPVFAVTLQQTPHGLPVTWVRVAGFLVVALLVLHHGFPIPDRTGSALNWLYLPLALVFIADLVLAHVRARDRKRVFESRRFDYLLLLFFAGLLLLDTVLPSPVRQELLRFLHLDSAAALAFNQIKLYLLLTVGLQLLRATQRLFGKGVRPELILGGSFATVILVGALLLLLPNSSARGILSLGMVDALFTATSATCVTGLVVRDTGTAFSPFGQTVILALVQVGGLGIITFVAFLSVFSTRALPVPQMVVFSQIVNAPASSDLKRQFVGILLATAVIELIGVILIYHFLPGDDDPLGRLKWSVFHAVSAFCNAGFALQHDSLVTFQSNAGLMFSFMSLIVLGGIGFLVIPELLRFPVTRSPLFRRLPFFRRLHAGHTPGRLTVQTKISLVATGVLLVTGFIGFWALEYNHILAGHAAGESFLIAAFQSVTARTAGFNTVAIEQLQGATLVFLMMLMVIGANPVSTGGGIKTVSFGILLLALRAMVTRRDKVEAFGRTIPVRTLFAALSVFVLYVIALGVGVFLLALFDPQFTLRQQVFEVISALSTVGLSTGITAELSAPSKIVLCLAMFIGRVGPISLVLSIFQSRRMVTYEFPEEEVVVG
jgi:trk system potassium uptake protein